MDDLDAMSPSQLFIEGVKAAAALSPEDAARIIWGGRGDLFTDEDLVFMASPTFKREMVLARQVAREISAHEAIKQLFNLGFRGAELRLT